jgi:predicted DsbA family dithiol-disulfide isomerase
MADKLGLDMSRFKTALDDHLHRAKVQADADAATHAGINGTPAFVIDGYYLVGAQPPSAFRRLIRRALLDHQKH